jgi:hypothetical protein
MASSASREGTASHPDLPVPGRVEEQQRIAGGWSLSLRPSVAVVAKLSVF